MAEPMELECSYLDGHTSPMEISSGDDSFSMSEAHIKTRPLTAGQNKSDSCKSVFETKIFDKNKGVCPSVSGSIMNDNNRVEPNLCRKRISMPEVATSKIDVKRILKRHSDIDPRKHDDGCDNKSLCSGSSTMRSLGRSTASMTSLSLTLSQLDESYVQPKAGCLLKLTFLTVFCCLVLFLSWLNVKSTLHCDTKINVAKLKQKLTANVFGQHIAIDILTSAFQDYQNEEKKNETNMKPLVLSFHGWTGVGKNYISKLIQEVVSFHEVTSFLVPLHFAHLSMDLLYEKDIQAWIHTNVSHCGRNLFVIDEMDKASDGVLSGFLAAISEMRTKTLENTLVIFIILSNAKSAKINEFLFSEMSHGRDRESISYEELLTIFEMEHEKEWYHQFLNHDLIDAYVPFLPLAQEHVKQCIRRNLKIKGVEPNEEMISRISSELMYFSPPDLNMKFSLTGCKRVSDKVDLHIFD